MDALGYEQTVADQCEHPDQGGDGEIAGNASPEMQSLQRGADAVQEKSGDRENQRSHNFLIYHCYYRRSVVRFTDLTGLVVSGR